MGLRNPLMCVGRFCEARVRGSAREGRIEQESAEITEIFPSGWNDLSQRPPFSLFPPVQSHTRRFDTEAGQTKLSMPIAKDRNEDQWHLYARTQRPSVHSATYS